MRIGFLVVKNLVLGGGVETYTYEVGRRLVALGHEVVVFSMGHYGEALKVVHGMTVITVPSIPGSATERLTASIAAVVCALRYDPRLDILHFHTPMTGVFGIIPELMGFPTVVQMHGVDWKRRRWGNIARNLIKRMEYVVMRFMPTITAVSQTQVEFYEEFYGRRLEMIPTGAQPAQISHHCNQINRLGLFANRYVLFMSRLVPEKCAHLLVSAFRRLRTDYKLVIAGGVVPSDDYTRSLSDLAKGDERIIFPGFVVGELKDQLLSHAAVYVQPSELEGLSIALLEAMSYGIPCLISDIPENIEAAGEDGFTFSNGNVDDLSSRLEEMLINKEERERVAIIVRDRVIRNFSWDGITNRLLSLYRHSLVKLYADGENLTFVGQVRRMMVARSESRNGGKHIRLIILIDSSEQEAEATAMISRSQLEFKERGTGIELISIAGLRIRQCSGCGQCNVNKNCQCAMTNDKANTIIAKMAAADGIIVGVGNTGNGLSPNLNALLQRAALVSKANDGMFRGKVGTVLYCGKEIRSSEIPDELLGFYKCSEIVITESDRSCSCALDAVGAALLGTTRQANCGGSVRP